MVTSFLKNHTQVHLCKKLETSDFPTCVWQQHETTHTALPEAQSFANSAAHPYFHKHSHWSSWKTISDKLSKTWVLQLHICNSEEHGNNALLSYNAEDFDAKGSPTMSNL